jgi:hypothetical protein
VKLYVVALLVVVGILGGFYGGYKIGQGNTVSASTAKQSQPPRTGGGGFAGGGGGGGRNFGAACPSPGAPSPSPGTNAVARGTVSNLTSSSMTITNTSCDVKVVFGNTVQVQKTVAGSTSDLTDNITITVIGTRQADGSIKATTIQIGNTTIQIGGGNPTGAAGSANGG